MPGCPFCDFTGKLTAEHVFGDWVSRTGLELQPVQHLAGPLNRIGRELGVRPPFRQTVRICGDCNNGWMSDLEAVAQRVLTPFILGQPGQIATEDAGAIAAWALKTALTAMLVSSEEQRNAGYGLPASEYRELWMSKDEARPSSASQFWVGRYVGESRLASAWVTPLTVTIEGLPGIDWPQGYSITIVLGELLLHGVRFTTPSLQVDVSTSHELPQLWPTLGPVNWPEGTPLGDAAFQCFAGGRDLRSTEPLIKVQPWKPAIELPQSEVVGDMVKLPTACGKHFICYPTDLVTEATHGTFYAFETACECPTGYLIQTEADGAHCTGAGTPEAISELYGCLPGEEIVIEDHRGMFVCKRLPKP